MPYCFQFTNRASGQVETLDTIDRLLCEAIGCTYSPKEYSLPYQILTLAAIGMTVRSADRSTIDEQGFEAYRAEYPDRINGDYWEIAKRFLLTEYEYSAWNQVH